MKTAKISHARVLKMMLQREGLMFDSDQGWEALENHIQTHRYLLGESLKRPISWDDALFSWYETVYKPLSNVLWSIDMKRTFPDFSSGNLYLALSNHWFYLKESSPETEPEEAVRDFVRQYGSGIGRFFSRFLV